MRIDKLVLDNFKSFATRTELDLGDPEPSDARNVILVGGMNGSGKTSIIEAINACLYGANADFVFARINRRNLKQGRGDVELGLDLTLDNNAKLSIRRRWSLADPRSRDPRDLNEELRITLDGKLVIAPGGESDWGELVDLIIPQGVSQFFFFDGEKIQDLAADTDPGGRLRESMESVLGIQLYRTLATDLESLVSRMRRAGARTGTSQVLEAQALVQRATEDAEGLRSERKEIEEDIAALAQSKETREAELRRSFGAGADILSQRDDLVKQRSQLDSELTAVNELVSEASKKALPFVGLQGQLVVLRERMHGERRFSEWQAAVRAGSERVQAITTRVLSPTTPCCDRAPDSAITDAFAKRLASALEEEITRKPEGLPDVVLLGLSADQQTSLEAQIEDILTKATGEVRLLLERRNKTLTALRAAELQLQRLAVSEAGERQLAALLQDITNINQNLGRKREQLREVELRLEEADRALREAQKRLIAAEEDLVVARDTQQRIDLAERTRKAVLEFVDTMRHSRAATLQEKCLEMYRRLSSRGETIQEIKIDPDTYYVTLIGIRGEEIPKSELAAGEKEIYAISLLWGLAQTAQRKLPIVIDTPLARLDSLHRDNIVQKYLPTAGHQVIVLSTDTEVDTEYYAVLEPSIAKAVHLAFDKTLDRTVVNTGYFWKS
jgi:DNA sulfur modification protein DndD